MASHRTSSPIKNVQRQSTPPPREGGGWPSTGGACGPLSLGYSTEGRKGRNIPESYQQHIPRSTRKGDQSNNLLLEVEASSARACREKKPTEYKKALHIPRSEAAMRMTQTQKLRWRRRRLLIVHPPRTTKTLISSNYTPLRYADNTLGYLFGP